jgi:hypothetical protein
LSEYQIQPSPLAAAARGDSRIYITLVEFDLQIAFLRMFVTRHVLLIFMSAASPFVTRDLAGGVCWNGRDMSTSMNWHALLSTMVEIMRFPRKYIVDT